MDEIKLELDRLLRKFVDSRKGCLITVASEVKAIVEAYENGQLDDEMKDELLEDVAELARVETTAELLETKIKVELALDLLNKLVRFV